MNKNIKISGKILARYNEIISDDALQLIQEIHEKFNNKRLELLNEIDWKMVSSAILKIKIDTPTSKRLKPLSSRI